MKKSLLSALVALSAANTALASGAVYNKIIEKDLEKTGKGMVYRNGKKILKKERVCALVRSNFATEAFDREILTIAFDGEPMANNYGVVPRSTVLNSGKTLWEGPVFYDPTTTETKVFAFEAVVFEYCIAESDTAFAGKCDSPDRASWTNQIMVYPGKRIEQTYTYQKPSANKIVTKVVCRLD